MFAAAAGLNITLEKTAVSGRETREYLRKTRGVGSDNLNHKKRKKLGEYD